jgi:hypothetical protein
LSKFIKSNAQNTSQLLNDCEDWVNLKNRCSKYILNFNKDKMIQTHSSAGIAQNPMLPAVLRLTLKKKWYDMILSGEKKEEYRELKSYWIPRLLCNFDWDKSKNEIQLNGGSYQVKNFNRIEFKNGYGKDAPTMLVEFKGVKIGEAKPEWSDNWQGEVFTISLGAVLHSR